MTARHRTHALPHHGGTVTTAPWLRAPLLLLRHPAVFLAIVAASAVLTIAAASGGLFVSTLDTASLQAQAAGDCPERSSVGFGVQVAANTAAAARKRGLAELNSRQPLGTPYAVEIAFAQVQTVPITLYNRPGALDHVTKLRGPGGDGVWIPDNFVQQWHVQPGGYLHTVTGKPIRIAGIYRSMSPSPFVLPNVPRYFCNWTDLIVRRLTEHGTGPLLISDAATIARVADPTTGAQLGFYEPLPLHSIPVKDAADAAARADAARDDFYATFPNAMAPEDSAYAAAPSTGTGTLFTMIERARESRSGVSGSVLPIDLAGVLVAAVLVAGAGSFWANHRAREIRLLVARGVGATPLALKAVLETLPPTLLGLGIGFAGAIAIIKSVSPTSVLGPGAVGNALLASAGALVFGLLLIAAIGAIASRERLVGARRAWHSGVPWELLLLGVAAVVGREIYAGHGVHVDGTIVQVRPALVIFPMIGSLAVLLVLGRLLAWALPRMRRRFTGGGAAFFLALRRIAGSRAISVGLIVCVALPTALLTYTSTLTSSVQDEVHAKYRTNIGAPRVLDFVGAGDRDLDLRGRGTNVAIYQSGPVLSDGTQVYVMGVDPSTFEDFALVAGDQRGLVPRLRYTASDDGVPALLVNGSSGLNASRLHMGIKTFGLHVIARRAVFPGLRASAYPLVVVDRAALRNINDINLDRDNQVWTSNPDINAVRAIIAQHGFHVLDEVTPQVLIDTTGLLPLTWIFSYLRALAIMIGLVAVVALVFALAARTRRRTVSYVLSRRMGLTRAAHLRSLLLELAVVAGLGFVIGGGVGAGAFRIIVASLDMYPDLPPGAAFSSPTGTWAITGAVWCAVVLLAAVGVQLLADRAKPAEILRLE